MTAVWTGGGVELLESLDPPPPQAASRDVMSSRNEYLNLIADLRVGLLKRFKLPG
jgi:hypothetical protein